MKIDWMIEELLLRSLDATDWLERQFETHRARLSKRNVLLFLVLLMLLMLYAFASVTSQAYSFSNIQSSSLPPEVSFLGADRSPLTGESRHGFAFTARRPMTCALPWSRSSRASSNSNVIGLFLNTVPSTIAVEENGPGATLLDEAREFGDGVERELAERLTRLNWPTEIHRVDGLADDIAKTASTRGAWGGRFRRPASERRTAGAGAVGRGRPVRLGPTSFLGSRWPAAEYAFRSHPHCLER